MTRSRYNHSLDIFEKETIKFVRSFFYERRKKRIRILAAVMVIPLIILGSSRLVKADLFYFYSPLCLGSWAHVRNAEGESQVPLGGNTTDFNNSNSAILKNSSGQIFCGKFESPNLPEGNIRGVTLKLSLAIQHEQSPQFIPQDLNNGNILDSEVDQSGTFIIDTSDLQGTIEESVEESEPKPEPEITEVESPSPTPESTPAPAPTQESTPGPTLEPTPTPSTPTPSPEEPKSEIINPPILEEAQPENPTSFFDNIFSTAHAQEDIVERPLNLDDLLSIQYTLDGENWIELGRITAYNWNDLSFKIPISSVDQINQLQISLISLPTADSAATIYLDSLWLEAETDSAVIELAGNILETILETLTLQNLTNDSEVAPSPEPKETKPVKIKEYNFDIGGSEKVDDELEWYTHEDIRKLEKTSKQDRNIDISTKDGSKSLVVSGSCKDKFYVVLLYRNREDYSKNPSSAVYNSAFECDGAINHRLETENLTGGDYWLLIGEQGDAGTWIPVSDLRKISLEVKEVETQQ